MKLKQLLQSRKFWTLIASLTTIWVGVYNGGTPPAHGIELTVIALGLYMVGTGLDNGSPPPAPVG